MPANIYFTCFFSYYSISLTTELLELLINMYVKVLSEAISHLECPLQISLVPSAIRESLSYSHRRQLLKLHPLTLPIRFSCAHYAVNQMVSMVMLRKNKKKTKKNKKKRKTALSQNLLQVASKKLISSSDVECTCAEVEAPQPFQVFVRLIVP